MGATEQLTEVPIPASVLIYSSPIIYGQLGSSQDDQMVGPFDWLKLGNLRLE
jgi:hypothetical protein